MTKKPPYLFEMEGLKRCSVCKRPFPQDAHINKAFAEHVLKAHLPGQTSEGVNQATARIARETTEK
jgi:hypothetical protein